MSVLDHHDGGRHRRAGFCRGWRTGPTRPAERPVRCRLRCGRQSLFLGYVQPSHPACRCADRHHRDLRRLGGGRLCRGWRPRHPRPAQRALRHRDRQGGKCLHRRPPQSLRSPGRRRFGCDHDVRWQRRCWVRRRRGAGIKGGDGRAQRVGVRSGARPAFYHGCRRPPGPGSRPRHGHDFDLCRNGRGAAQRRRRTRSSCRCPRRPRGQGGGRRYRLHPRAPGQHVAGGRPPHRRYHHTGRRRRCNRGRRCRPVW